MIRNCQICGKEVVRSKEYYLTSCYDCKKENARRRAKQQWEEIKAAKKKLSTIKLSKVKKRL